MKDIRLELLFAATIILFLFTLFDFTHCLVAYDLISYQTSLTYQIVTILIPGLFVLSVIVKMVRWNTDFKDILFEAYALLFFWIIIIGITLPISLVFAGFCDAIITVDMFI